MHLTLKLKVLLLTPAPPQRFRRTTNAHVMTSAEGTIFIAAVDAVSSCRPSSPSRRPSGCRDFGARVFSVPLLL
jgi:hypothetical protein